MRLLALVVAASTWGCGSSTLSGPCSLSSPCGGGEICDFTDPEGPVCVDSDGDIDGDGLSNGKDYCQHQEGGEFDEDKDGIGDDCDSCPIAPPRMTADTDGDKVESPCDPAPSEPGDEILFFDGFNGALGAEWKPTTASAGAWTVANGELSVNLSTIAGQQNLQRIVNGKSNVAIEAGYKIDRVENSDARHLVAVYANDPRPAGTAQVTCGVSRADAATQDLVFVMTNFGAMSAPTLDPALLTSKTYRASTYVSGARAGCVVIADNAALGTVQANITADDLSSIALTAQAASVRFQYVIVVGH